MTTPTPHALEVARVAIADVQRTGYTIECSHGGYTALVNAVAALIDREREIERLRRESSPDWMRAERDQAVAESERLRDRIRELEEIAKTAAAYADEILDEKIKSEDALRSEIKRLRGCHRSEIERLRRICHDSFMTLPVPPGPAMAFVDSDITPHVRAVADEYAVLRAQVDAFRSGERDLLREIERLRGELADMYRIHKLRGEALQRPCIHCGYQPKVIVAMDATSAPRAEGGGWPQENDHASM